MTYRGYDRVNDEIKRCESILINLIDYFYELTSKSETQSLHESTLNTYNQRIWKIINDLKCYNDILKNEGLISNIKKPDPIEILGNKLLKSEGFVCIYDRKIKYDQYCDDCPLAGSTNDWSEEAKSFCNKQKNFSK